MLQSARPGHGGVVEPGRRGPGARPCESFGSDSDCCTGPRERVVAGTILSEVIGRLKWQPSRPG
jgi:hypothetical protein